MKEQTIGQWITLIIFFTIVLLLISVGTFIFEFNATNSFKQYVNYQIEREGGLTPEALSIIETENNAYYGGRYTLSSPQLNQSINYGEKVKYTIDGTFQVVIFPIANIGLRWQGEATSLIRGD